MKEQTVFYLIRHAEPESGTDGRVCLGQKLDVPLSSRGCEQAARLGERMKGKPLDAVYVSPLLRARQTAEALSKDCPRIIEPALTEVSGGEWEGMRFSEIYARYPEYFDFSEAGGGKTPPGGESDEEALARGLAFLNGLAGHPGAHYALVTHSGLGRILLCHLLGMPMHRKRTIPMKYASCTELSCREGTWDVKPAEELDC